MSAHKPTPNPKPGTKAQPVKPVLKAARSGAKFKRSWLLAHALLLGVAVSIAAHGVMFATGFIAVPAGPRIRNDRGLEIVLVNSKHAQAPKNAQALAQANLDGGGNTEDEKAMPSSPLPPDPDKRDGDSLVETNRRVEQLEAVQRDLLAASKARPNAVPVEKKPKNDENPNDADPSPKGIDLTRASAIARQEAVVEKSLKEYASRPRKVFVSPRTQYASQAQYLMAWSTKVARVGELNFPRNIAGSLYGSVQIQIEVRSDGALALAEIVRPDRNPKINDAALRIIHIAAPFAPFPPEISKDADILGFVRTLTFTRDDIVLQ